MNLKITFGIALAFGLAFPAQAQADSSDKPAASRPSDQDVKFGAQNSSSESTGQQGRGEFERLQRKALEQGAPHACPHPNANSGLCNVSPG